MATFRPFHLPSAARVLALPALPLRAAACSTTGAGFPPKPAPNAGYAAKFGDEGDRNRAILAGDTSEIAANNLRQMIDYKTDRVGAVVVDLHQGRTGIRGRGRGSHRSQRTMVALEIRPGLDQAQVQALHEIRRWGLEGDIHNPLGAHALHLYQGGEDTLYRIHGTTESLVDRQVRAIRMHSSVQPGHHRSAQSRAERA